MIRLMQERRRRCMHGGKSRQAPELSTPRSQAAPQLSTHTLEGEPHPIVVRSTWKPTGAGGQGVVKEGGLGSSTHSLRNGLLGFGIQGSFPPLHGTGKGKWDEKLKAWKQLHNEVRTASRTTRPLGVCGVQTSRSRRTVGIDTIYHSIPSLL